MTAKMMKSQNDRIKDLEQIVEVLVNLHREELLENMFNLNNPACGCGSESCCQTKDK